MKSYSRILRAISSHPWAITRDKLEAIATFLELRVSGVEIAPELRASLRAAHEANVARANLTSKQTGAVAIIPMYGVVSHRMSLFSEYSGGTSTEAVAQQFRSALQDPQVSAIVLDVDSPGGSIDGVPELAAEIFKARGKKPITAVANTLMASAAYWIASQADEIVASPSAEVGSIGVYGAHEDDSKYLEDMGVKITLISAGKYKTEGNSYEPLSDEAYAAMKAVVDEYYGMFVRAVAKARDVKADAVMNGFGEGRCVTASNALKLGMIDRIATFDEVLSKYGVARPTSPLRSATGSGSPQAADPADPDNNPAEEICQCACAQCAEANHSMCSNMECSDMNCKGCPQQAKAKGEGLHGAIRADAEDGDGCECPCDSCESGECGECSNPECDDPNCEGCPEQDKVARASAEHEHLSRQIELAELA